METSILTISRRFNYFHQAFEELLTKTMLILHAYLKKCCLVLQRLARLLLEQTIFPGFPVLITQCWRSQLMMTLLTSKLLRLYEHCGAHKLLMTY